MNTANQTTLARESALKDDINSYKITGIPAKTKLITDEKVLARVTDGIYRQPGSALRELISNAYDADANQVIIKTDAPRFETMTIRDDGNGMSIDTLVNLTNHIGGSAKRNGKGKILHVTAAEDITLSPVKKRKLIGKIGIGLFSVAQLTREFEITTKQKGNDFYLKALIKLNNFSDEATSEIEERGEGFESGEVIIWTESTDNINSSGTDIILKNIKKSAKDILKSLDVWGQSELEFESNQSDDSVASNLNLPSFHIGCVSGQSGFEVFEKNFNREPNLPWDDCDPEDSKFKKLYQAVLDLTKTTVNPKLNVVLDSYLNMLWTLSLSVPLDYIDKHPFSLSTNDIAESYVLSNKAKTQAQKITAEYKGKAFSDFLPLNTKTQNTGFDVVIDGVKLYRPLRFSKLPIASAVVKEPIFFIGSHTPDFSAFDAKDSGGELSFDAYILWNPKIIPRDHNGVLIRLHNASGIMFDETFMKHQVAEHTIKSQLSIEIFVNKGLDSALNIDRESFNISHPHYQIIMKWLHKALRQVFNKFKSIRNEKLEQHRNLKSQKNSSRLDVLVNESLRRRGMDFDEKKELVITDSIKNIESSTGEKYIVTEKTYKSVVTNKKSSTKDSEIKAKVQAILQLLDSYGLLNDLTPKTQELLFEDILKIVCFEGE